MFLDMSLLLTIDVSFPRVCGDVSNMKLTQNHLTRLSPRMRGCFQKEPTFDLYDWAFPAYAGMFLRRSSVVLPLMRFPRVCGDVSPHEERSVISRSLSPRMRGCFLTAPCSNHKITAFPAYAGMFLVQPLRQRSFTCFPRVCGDVSTRL